MGLERMAIAKTGDLPIRHVGDVHSGKVRSVFWLSNEDSARLINQRGYAAAGGTQLGVMVISDRISAYEIIWQGEEGLMGVPGKGASLNSTAEHWFRMFEHTGLGGNHIIDTPHPLVWIVRRAEPLMIEAIARQYITGSMWRAYAGKGQREICGIQLPDGLQKDQKLKELLITPSTKGILRGIPGVPEKDDVDVARQDILDNYKAFGFQTSECVGKYEHLLREGFRLISQEAMRVGQLLADTKFEFGYVQENAGSPPVMLYIDEVGTLDSSRYWDAAAYKEGKTVENSKEMFRKVLCDSVPDRDVLLNKDRMLERVKLGKIFKVPVEAMMLTSDLYRNMAEKLTGTAVPRIENARQEILDSLSPYELVD